MGIHIQRPDIIEGKGSPKGILMPIFKGQEYLDTDTNTYWKAISDKNTNDWVRITPYWGFNLGSGKVIADNNDNLIRLITSQNISTRFSDLTDEIELIGPDLSIYAKIDYVDGEIKKLSNNLKNFINDSLNEAGKSFISNITLEGDSLTANNKYGTPLCNIDLTKYGRPNIGTVTSNNGQYVATNTGDSIKILGSRGITTSIEGKNLTIIGPDLSNLITQDSFDNKLTEIGGNITNLFAKAELRTNNLVFLNTKNMEISRVDLSKYENKNSFGKIKFNDKILNSTSPSDNLVIKSKGLDIDFEQSTNTVQINVSNTTYSSGLSQW